MKPNIQSGLSSLQIIIILTVLALILVLVTTLTGTNEEELTAQNNADTANSDTPIENVAQNMAESQTESVTQAANERNGMIEAQIDANEVAEDPGGDMDDSTASADSAPSAPAGTFSEYSPDKLALAENGTVVLFFHADWCPSCRALENDINANLGQIPANTHILKLDYDTETELKQQYGVIRQHTLVEVDANGAEIKQLTGLTNTLDQVADQL